MSDGSTTSSFDTMEGETEADRQPVNFTVGEEEEVSGTDPRGTHSDQWENKIGAFLGPIRKRVL